MYEKSTQLLTELGFVFIYTTLINSNYERKAKRIKTVNEVNPENTNEQEFSDAELALLNLIAKIIVDISLREANEQNRQSENGGK